MSVTNSSTVASRNPLPPDYTKRNSAIHPSSTLHKPQSLPQSPPQSLRHGPHAKADNKPLKTLAVAATSTTLTSPAYPTSVLKAASALESILPPYLHTTANTKANVTNPVATNIYKPLRPQAGSDDTSRLVTLLKSARELIVHLSVKKVSEGSKALILQAELLRIAEQREATIKVLQAKVRHLRTMAGKLRLE
ncbi:hypothetical protein DV737_g3607, partial [Chaetothyriales sp. CBS 132003]